MSLLSWDVELESDLGSGRRTDVGSAGSSGYRVCNMCSVLNRIKRLIEVKSYPMYGQQQVIIITILRDN